MNKYRKYKRLEDIPLPDKDIDKKISNLVRALDIIGIKTHASCKGHLDYERHQHPWVGFNPFSFVNIAVLECIIEEYNKDHKLKWKINNSWLVPLNYTKFCTSCNNHYNKPLTITKKKITQLQQSANRLAQYMYNLDIQAIHH